MDLLHPTPQGSLQHVSMLNVLDRGLLLDSSRVEGHTVSSNNETIVSVLLIIMSVLECMQVHVLVVRAC